MLNPEYSALTEQEALRKYRSLLAADNSIYWNRSGNQAMLIQLIPGAAEKPFGAIMLAVDPKEMESILQSLSPYPDGSALLLDQNQEVLFHEGEIDFEKTLLKEVKKQPEGKGHFQMEWDGKVYSVSFGDMNRMHQQWTFVSAAPLSAITAPMVFLSKVIIVMLVICICLAVCMTWYASKKSTVPYSICLAYLPVERRKHGRRPGRMNSSGLKSDGMIYPLKAESFKSNSCGRHPI